MIARKEADRLRGAGTDGSVVASVYLPVPLDLADHRGLPVSARELVKSAAKESVRRGGPQARERDFGAIWRIVGEHSQDWLGHTIALFADSAGQLAEAVPLPGILPEHAVIDTRTYTRPLYAAIQRNPAYRVAVIDTRHAWILAIYDDRIDTVTERVGEGVPSSGFAGWYGLESYRIQQRVIQLSRQHFRDTIAILQRPEGAAPYPLVIGGHDSEVSHFLSMVPRGLAETVAGTFSLDLRTATPARVRELAGPVMARWARDTEDAIVSGVLAEPPGTSVASDLRSCLAAARTGAVGHLLLSDRDVVPGFACDDCGALGLAAGECDCPGPPRPARAVPDVLDVLAGRVRDDGGQVTAVRGAPFAAAARLRFPMVTGSVA